MQKYDVALYGHLTIDRIFTEFELTNTLGAIGNIWEAIIYTDPSLMIDIQPLAIGEAIILVNKRKGTRLGRGKLNLKTTKGKPSSAVWHHIMYLNQLEDVSFMKDIKDGIISVDITSGKMKNIEMLKYVDYMFISDEDLFMDINELANLVRGWVVLHYPTGSTITNGKETATTETKLIDNLNVLGAGDIFAGCFITEMISNKKATLSDCAATAHENTSSILKGNSNGKG